MSFGDLKLHGHSDIFFLGVNWSGHGTNSTTSGKFYKALGHLHGPWCKQPLCKSKVQLASLIGNGWACWVTTIRAWERWAATGDELAPCRYCTRRILSQVIWTLGNTANYVRYDGNVFPCPQMGGGRWQFMWAYDDGYTHCTLLSRMFKLLRATSHMSQGPWPCNCESPKESVQRPSQHTSNIM